MREQLGLHALVGDLGSSLRDAWKTAADYDAALSQSPSEPKVYEERLRRQLGALYVEVVFALEALQLPAFLADFRAGFARFRKTKRIALETDELGLYYPVALEYLATFIWPLTAATSDGSERVSDLARLERVLRATPRILMGRGIKPTKEGDVRSALFEALLPFFPDAVLDVPIPKPIKGYKPDIGVRSLKAVVEVKFADSKEELKRAIDGVFVDVSGYKGSSDWKHFFALFYSTDAFMTEAMVVAAFKSSNVGRSWTPILVHGRGARTGRRVANKGLDRPTASKPRLARRR